MIVPIAYTPKPKVRSRFLYVVWKSCRARQPPARSTCRSALSPPAGSTRRSAVQPAAPGGIPAPYMLIGAGLGTGFAGMNGILSEWDQESGGACHRATSHGGKRGEGRMRR